MVIRDQFCSVELTNLLINKYKIDHEKSLMTHGSAITYLRDAFRVYLTILPAQRMNSYSVKGFDRTGKLIIDYDDNLSGLYEKVVDNALLAIFKML